MGEILAYAGRAEEAEKWVRKSMRLNPYHPPRYWTHLARALFHLQRYDEALDALDHVATTRLDDLAFRVAASAAIGDPDALARSVTELRAQHPDFDVERFAKSMPYGQDADRQALLEPLAASLSE